MAKKATGKAVMKKSPVRKTAVKASASKRAGAAKKTLATRNTIARHTPPKRSALARRSDLGQPGSAAIERMPEPQRTIALAVDRMIRNAAPGATSIVKWGNAIYRRDGKAFAVVHETRRGINLALPGTKLDDPEGLLEGTGKVMRHIKVHDAAMVKRAGVVELVKQAVGVGFTRM